MTRGKAGSWTEACADREIFSAVIQPHRSLGPNGMRIVLTLCCLASVAASVPFIVLGVWPVSGFFGLDLLALVIALRVNTARGRRFEQVVVTRLELLLRQVSHRGHRSEWRFNPLWTRLDRISDAEYGLLSLSVVSRTERVVIARDLSPAERETLANALGEALADARKR